MLRQWWTNENSETEWAAILKWNRYADQTKHVLHRATSLNAHNSMEKYASLLVISQFRSIPMFVMKANWLVLFIPFLSQKSCAFFSLFSMCRAWIRCISMRILKKVFNLIIVSFLSVSVALVCWGFSHICCGESTISFHVQLFFLI